MIAKVRVGRHLYTRLRATAPPCNRSQAGAEVERFADNDRYAFVELAAETFNRYEVSYRSPSILVSLDRLINAGLSFSIELDVHAVMLALPRMELDAETFNR